MSAHVCACISMCFCVFVDLQSVCLLCVCGGGHVCVRMYVRVEVCDFVFVLDH